MSRSSADSLTANVIIPNVDPTTSLAYSEFFYVQTANSDHIHAYQITWESGTTSTATVHNDRFSLEGTYRVPNSRFAATTAIDSQGSEMLLFFDQVGGSDITEYSRELDSSTDDWSSAQIGIPDQ